MDKYVFEASNKSVDEIIEIAANPVERKIYEVMTDLKKERLGQAERLHTLHEKDKVKITCPICHTVMSRAGMRAHVKSRLHVLRVEMNQKVADIIFNKPIDTPIPQKTEEEYRLEYKTMLTRIDQDNAKKIIKNLTTKTEGIESIQP